MDDGKIDAAELTIFIKYVFSLEVHRDDIYPYCELFLRQAFDGPPTQSGQETRFSYLETKPKMSAENTLRHVMCNLCHFYGLSCLDTYRKIDLSRARFSHDSATCMAGHWVSWYHYNRKPWGLNKSFVIPSGNSLYPIYLSHEDAARFRRSQAESNRLEEIRRAKENADWFPGLSHHK
jgi:hypothetical protein